MQRKKALMTLAAIMAAASITACGSGVKDGMDAAKADNSKVESVDETVDSVDDSVDDSVVSVDDSVVSVDEAQDPDALADDNPLKGIAEPTEMRTVYDEIEALMNESYLSGPLSTETDNEKIRALEDELIQQVADSHGLTYENVRDIYMYAGSGYLYNYDKDAIEIKHGEFVEAYINGTTLVVKAKIEPSLTNDLTISQNYFNVADIIKNQNGDVFNEIQYWAVALMTSGEESKVISFDVPKSTIDAVMEERIADNQIGEYSENLWILPSLLQ